MYPENPGVALHRRHATILPTTATAVGMEDTLQRLAAFAVRLGQGEAIGPPWQAGYLPHGTRRVELRENSAASARWICSRRGCVTRLSAPKSRLPDVARVAPAPPVQDLAHAQIAIVTTSGLVPHGNPDKLRQSYSTEWKKYSIDGLSRLNPADWESIHGGFDTSAANTDPHLVLPLDALRALEGSAYGQLHSAYYVTAGVGTAVSAAQRMGAEIAAELVAADIGGVILTAT